MSADGDESDWPDYSHLPPYWEIAEAAKEIAEELWPDGKFLLNITEWTNSNYHVQVQRSIDHTLYGTSMECILFAGNADRGWGCASYYDENKPADTCWLGLGHDTDPDHDQLIEAYEALMTQRAGDSVPTPESPSDRSSHPQ